MAAPKPLDPEAQRAALAQALKHVEDQWVHELELIAFRARLAKARFDALRKAGFDACQALQLCCRQVEL